MLRAGLVGLGVTLAALTCWPGEGFASGRGASVAGRAPAGMHAGGQGWRGVGARGDSWRPPGHRQQARRHGRFLGGPSLYGYDPSAERVVTRDVEVERPAPADPFAFANLPVRAGIPYPPTPEPTLYRIEGRPDRPVVRVIRIADRQARERRTRGLYAETGALLLSVPGRR